MTDRISILGRVDAPEAVLEIVGAYAGLVARMTVPTGESFDVPLRFSALHCQTAGPVKVLPAWEAGKPETNFARFSTNRGETWDAFDAGEMVDLPLARVSVTTDGSITCETADGSLTVTIEEFPQGLGVAWSFQAPADGCWSVVFDPFDGVADEAVSAILAGPFLTERRLPAVRGVLPEGWTAAPFALVETGGSLTSYVASHPDLPAWDWETERESRYALGARGQDGQVRPFLVAPVLGCAGSEVEAGATLSHRALFGICQAGWWETWRWLASEVFGLRSYRENLAGSMTGAVLNMVDLLKDDTFSGWMERGRGFLNIEHRDGVKLASPGAIASAALLTGDRDLMEHRAQPVVEYSISRSHYGFTWAVGSKTVGEDHVRQAFEDIGGPAWDSPVLVALAQLSRGYTPALRELALDQAGGISDFYIRRSDFQVSLALYSLSGDEEHLARAREQADAYIACRIDRPDHEPVEGQRFLIHIGPDWISLLDLWEVTGEERFLAAAERGARWMAVQMWVGTIPDAEPRLTPAAGETARRISRFDRHMYDNPDGPSSWMRDLVDYLRTADGIAQETTPAWTTSPVGMSFEAWCTYWGRMVLNPGWAPYFLRLATATGDSIYRILAENAVVGRFSNYPGYYQYVPTVVQAKPDFPYTGPMDLTSIYYHHIPPQIGIAIDYLFEVMRDRSGRRIAFPIARDDSYVQFRHHLPGFAPGVFFDIDDAWPWLPPALVETGSVQLDWIAGVDSTGKRLGVALANGSGREVTTTIRLDLARLGRSSGDVLDMRVLDAEGGMIRKEPLMPNGVSVTIPARGLVALRIDGCRVDEPWHQVPPAPEPGADAWLTLVDGDPDLGTIRAAVVGFEPDRQSAYVFSTVMPDRARHLEVAWEQGGESGVAAVDRFPFEVSIPMTGPSIRFRVSVTGLEGQTRQTGDFDLHAVRKEGG